MSESKTPRTDAQHEKCADTGFVDTKFAMQLETEHNERLVLTVRPKRAKRICMTNDPIKLNRAAYQRQLDQRLLATGILAFITINVLIASAAAVINYLHQ